MSALFLSHSNQDRVFATRLAKRLTQKGFDSFFLDFDPEKGIPAGRDWETEIYRHIRNCTAVLFLCSPNSLDSKWCFAELAMARAFPKRIIPIRIKDCDLPNVLLASQAIDLRTDTEQAFEGLRKELEIIVPDVKRFQYKPNRPPYPGIYPFDADDAAVFFGRSEEINFLVEKLENLKRDQSGLALVVGQSGSGKSSLVNAGVLPLLRRIPEQWIVLEPTIAGPGTLQELVDQLHSLLKKSLDAPNHESISQLLKEAVSTSDPLQDTSLVPLLHKARRELGRTKATMLWVVDQAERLLDEGKETTKVLSFLGNCAGSAGLPLLVLIALRSDHYDTLSENPAIKDKHFHREVLWLQPLATSGLRSIIEGPAQQALLDVEPSLVDVLIEDAKGRDVLPLLAFALRELWDRSQERVKGRGERPRELTLADYRDGLGGLEGCLARKAKQVMDNLALKNEEAVLLKKTMCRMARVGERDTFLGQPLPWKDVPNEVEPAIHDLINARLLVSRADEVEVAHEIIFRAWDDLSEWLKAEKDVLHWRERLKPQLEDWITHGKDIKKIHLSGASLAEAENLLNKRRDSLNEDEKQFIYDSLERSRREDERWRRAYQVSLSRQLTAQAQVTIRSEAPELTERGLLLAVEGMNRCAELGLTSLEADQAVRQGLSISARRVASLTAETKIDWEGVGIHPRSATVAYGGNDGRTWLWNLEKRTTSDGPRLGGSVTWIEYSPDGKRLAIGDDGGGLRLLDAKTCEVQPLKLPAKLAPVRSICFSRDGHLLAVTFHTQAAVWELDAMGEPVVLEHKTDSPLVSMTFSQDGEILATQEVVGETLIWRWRTREVVGNIGLLIAGTNVSHSPDGRFLGISSTMTFKALIWDIFKQEQQILAKNAAKLAFSQDGRFVGIASPEHFAQIWKLPELMPAHRFQHNDEVWELEFSPDGSRLVTCGKNGVAYVWNTENGAEVARMIHQDHLRSARFLADSRHVLTHSGDGTLTVWDSQELREARLFRHQVAVLGVAFSPDGPLLATNARQSPGKLSPQLIDFAAQRPVEKVKLPDGGEMDGADYAKRILEDHDKRSRGEVHSPKDRVIAKAEGMRVKLFCGKVEEEPFQTLPHDHKVSRIVFSPDGRYLVTASDNDTGRIWDVERGQEVSRLTHENPSVVDVDFSPDGRFVATASWDFTARLWLWRSEDLIKEAASRVGRNLTADEWHKYLPEEPYRDTFPGLESLMQTDTSRPKKTEKSVEK